MPAYSKFRVAELKQLCVERGINCQGLNKPAIVDALKQHDRCADHEEIETVNNDDCNDDDTDSESVLDFNDGHEFSDRSDAASEAEVAGSMRDMGEESDSVTALKLQLILKDKELAIMQKQLEIEKQRLLVQAQTHSNATAHTDIRDIKPLLPMMTNDDVLSFFMSYERVMTLNDVPIELWAKFLPAQLTPKALKTYTRLSIEQSRDYEGIKDAILASFQLTPEAYFRIFRNMRRSGNCTYALFLQNLCDVLQRYCEANKANDFQTFFDCMLKEQFLSALPPNVHAFVLSHQQNCQNVYDYAKAADLCYQVKRISDDSGRPDIGGAHYRPRGPITHAQRRAGQQRTGNDQIMTRPAHDNWRGAHSGPHNGRGNPNLRGRGPPRPGTQLQRENGGSFWASDAQRKDQFDSDILFDSVCENVKSDSIVYADKEFVVPLFIDGYKTQGIRDSGHNSTALVSKRVIRPESIDYQKCITLKGAFDGNKTHTIPTAVVKLRSPRFCYDKDVEVRVGVTEMLSLKVDCLIGNGLFKLHPHLKDIIIVRECEMTEHAGAQDQIDSECSQTMQHTHINHTVIQPEGLLDSDRSGLIDLSYNTSQENGRQTDVVDGTDIEGKVQIQVINSDKGLCARQDLNNDLTNVGTSATDSSEAARICRQRPTADNEVPGTTFGLEHAMRAIATAHGAKHAQNQIATQTEVNGQTDVQVTAMHAMTRHQRMTARNKLLDGEADPHDMTDEPAERPNKASSQRQSSSAERVAAGQTPGQAETLDDVARRLGSIDMTDKDVTDTCKDGVYNASEFAKAQTEDETLSGLWHRAKGGSSELCIRDGLLYKRISPSITSPHELALVLPVRYQREIISLSHNGLLSGHFGVRKTQQRIEALFFFPGMRKKIRQHIRCCDKCQLVAPLRTKERVPLQHLDVTAQHAFNDISVDVLGGQLPVTKRKNRYILSIICNVTKFLHLIPLTNIKAETIANKLIEYFAFTGLPQIIRSDNMPAFRSEILEAMRRKLGIEARFSAPFHFMSHGAIERVQATVENVLRKLLMEHKQWDEQLPYVLFALREIPHSTTGLSPAELVFGHKFRGLLHVARDIWTRHDDPMMKCKNMSTVRYIEQLRQRIDSALKVASDNSRTARERMKSQYDKRVTVRELSPNDLALVLLPTSGNKLLATWSGPYKVLRGCGNGNYELQVGKRKATYHINSLRKYYVEQEREKLCAMIVEDSDENEGIPQIVPNWPTGGDREFTTGEQLTAAQRDAMQHLLADYPEVFTDEPGKTDLITHTIKLTDDKPC